MKRAIVIVLDSVGIGHAPDAEAFGDLGADTLCNTVKATGVELPNMTRLGLGNINGVDCIDPQDEPAAAYGRMIEVSQGKDTTIGHWELAGLQIDHPLPTYPDGFPAEVMDAFHQAIGRESLVNKPYSGTEIIAEYGEEHMRTGKPIVYTSNDSVFQIAAHEDVIPIEQLYDMCQKARDILTGEHAVTRVIARPFIGQPGKFQRTANRRDYSLSPFEDTVLDQLKASGYEVISVGKIEDIYNGQGITSGHHIDSNLDGIKQTIELMKTTFQGLLFVNLVDFDAVYGHRRNPQGYADALRQFDDYLPEIIDSMEMEDLLIITADHGNDPTFHGTDHTRETVPILIYGKQHPSKNLGDIKGFYALAATLADYFVVKGTGRGESLL